MTIWIHTPTPDLQQSLDFYRRLNFTVLNEESPYLVSDGQALIEINPDRYARAGLKLFGKSWKNALGKLSASHQIYPVDGGNLLRDLNGIWVYLMDGMPPQSYPRAEISFGTTGNFAGLSIETTDMGKSLDFWEVLGFKVQNGGSDKGWSLCIHEDGLGISFMKPLSCPHLFYNPSLTYFNSGKNPEIIEKIKEAGITIAEEITFFNKEGEVDNIIIRDPGGYGFFIFND